MSETQRCPHCGEPLESNRDVAGSEGPAMPASLLAATTLIAPGSNDDAFFKDGLEGKAAAMELDPFLGPFAMSAASTASPSMVAAGQDPAPSEPRSSSRSSLFPAINMEPVGTISSVRIPPLSVARSVPESDQVREVEEIEDEPEERRSGWSAVLLASYASAATLALAWFVMKDRARENAQPPAVVAREEKAESPLTADRSKKYQAPEPILGEHMGKLGQPLRVGSLEITPMDVKRQDVKLVKTSVLSVTETKDGGKKALVLRLRLKNLTDDAAFAPLDPLYLRARGDQLVDTFVTTANDERVYPFPLALESDLSVVGQDFTELRPRESRVVSIVTAPEAPPDTAGPFRWRVRLRTGIGRTDVIGLSWPSPAEPKADTKPK